MIKNSVTEIIDSFLKEFPLPGPGIEGTMLNMSKFDNWAIRNGHYGRINLTSTAELNEKRNKLRKMLSYNGSHKDRRDSNEVCFSVDVVGSYGKGIDTQYRITPIARAISLVGASLPKKVRSVMHQRSSLMKRYMECAEWSNISPELRIKTQIEIERVDDTLETVEVVLGQCERGFLSLNERIAAEFAEIRKANDNEASALPNYAHGEVESEAA